MYRSARLRRRRPIGVNACLLHYLLCKLYCVICTRYVRPSLLVLPPDRIPRARKIRRDPCPSVYRPAPRCRIVSKLDFMPSSRPGQKTPSERLIAVAHRLQSEVAMYEVERMPEFDRWLNGLKDGRARTNIVKRIREIAKRGQIIGDWKQVGDGVFELRFHEGPGYRVYLARRGYKLILLLLGGNKAHQSKDIARAKLLWRHWRRQNGNRIF